MEFSAFRSAVQAAFQEMTQQGQVFRSSLDTEELWNLYLDSFPAGTNDIFRVRRERDCSACHTFVRHIGAAVTITADGHLRSLWSYLLPRVEGAYVPVVTAMVEFASRQEVHIQNVFFHEFGATIGIDKNRCLIGEEVTTYEHLFVTLPEAMRRAPARIGPDTSELKARFDVLLRSMKEITDDAVETVHDLIADNVIYRGYEKMWLIKDFIDARKTYKALTTDGQQQNYVWKLAGDMSNKLAAAKIRNDVIGTLLVDLSDGADLEIAVKTYEDKVSGTNYQRPTALVTEKMKQQAREALASLGLMPSLDRRYARYEDVGIGNVLFANPTVKRRMGDVLDAIQTRSTNPAEIATDQVVPMEHFVNDILPRVSSIEVLVENRHRSNFASLVTAEDATAPLLFKWDNPFSWTYAGEVADSVKERVKAAGGSVTGDLCCRLAWSNFDDLDFHMVEASGEHISYSHKKSDRTGGNLDVDMNYASLTKEPVENIVYPDRFRMAPGRYQLYVHQFTKRESTNVGFTVDIEVDGTTHRLSHPKAVSPDKKVPVALIVVDQNHNITVTPQLEGGVDTRSQEVWGIQTNQFVPVTALMLSPNFWGGNQIGNKHWFFMLAGCNNPDTARGFYNEFLRTDLHNHRKVMEQVGSVVRTDSNPDQMSGLGFSSTQRNEITVRVSGAYTRTLKITF